MKILDDVDGALGHALRQFLDGDRLGQHHFAQDLLARLLCMARLNFSCRRRIADSERARASSSSAVAEFSVSLPRRRSSSPLVRGRTRHFRRRRCGATGSAAPRLRFGSCLRLIVAGGQVGELRRAAARLFLGAAARLRPRLQQTGFFLGLAARGFLALALAALLVFLRGAWRLRRRAGDPRPRAPCEPSSARRRASISPADRSFSTRCRGRSATGAAAGGALRRFGRRRDDLRLNRRRASARKHGATSGFSPGIANLRFLVSTTTDFVRPCEKFWRTVPCSTPGRFSVRVFFGLTLNVLSSPVFVSLIPYPLRLHTPSAIAANIAVSSGDPPRYRSSATMRFCSRPSRVSRKNGSMYHICAAQCQTQFRLRKKVCRPVFPGLPHGPSRVSPGRSCASPSSDASAACSTRRALAAAHRSLDLGRAERHDAGLAGKPERTERRLGEQPVDHAAQIVAATRQLGLEARARTGLLAPPSRHAARSAVTQQPRPGRFLFRSGTTASSGPTTKRISSSGSACSRVTMQVRSFISSKVCSGPAHVTLRASAGASASASFFFR